MDSFFCEYFHNIFAANSGDQITGKKFWTKMVAEHVYGVFRYVSKKNLETLTVKGLLFSIILGNGNGTGTIKN